MASCPNSRLANAGERCGPRAWVLIRRFTAAARWGQVLDACPDGLGLLLPTPLRPGTALVVELTYPGLSTAHPAVGRVAHATPLPGGGFRVGCSLASRLPAAVLRALTALAEPTHC